MGGGAERCATNAAAQERCTEAAGGAWAAEAGVWMKVRRHNATATVGRKRHLQKFRESLPGTAIIPVGDMIITPIDAKSVEKRTNASWAAFRGVHKISKKTNQSTKGNMSELIHWRSYADVAATPA